MTEKEPTDDLSTWTWTMIEARRKQLMNDAYEEIKEHNDRIMAINKDLARLREEEIRRSVEP